MDVRRTFRALLTNQPCSESVYGHKFSFQTVFYKSPNTDTYCCCPCAFQHEFLSYISEDGDIVEEIYNEVIQNIVDGKCPHIDDVPRHFVTETSVYGTHIAAAVGTSEILQSIPQGYVIERSSVFHLDAYMVGVSKKNFKGLSNFYDTYITHLKSIHYKYLKASGKSREMFVLTRSADSVGICSNAIRVEVTSLIEFSLKQRSLTLFEDRQDRWMAFSRRDLQKILHCLDKDLEIPNESLNFIFWFSEWGKICEHDFSVLCGRALSETAMTCRNMKLLYQILDTTAVHYSDLSKYAIVYNQPGMLNTILDKPGDEILEFRKRVLGEVCSVFQRNKCKEVLLERGIETPDLPNIPLFRKAEILFDVRDTVRGEYKQEIDTRLQEFLKIETFDVSMLRSYIKDSNVVDIRIIKMMLALDMKIDSIVAEESTLIIDLLRRIHDRFFIGARAVVDLLLYENFDMELNKDAVEVALELDSNPEVWNTEYIDFQGDYITDCKLHSRFSTFADTTHLEFHGPLLIECGFPCTKDKLMQYLDKPLHPWEQEYLQQCIDTPRSLKLSCRDCLRRHFKRKVHQFVKTSEIPKSLKDFILLRTILVNQE